MTTAAAPTHLATILSASKIYDAEERRGRPLSKVAKKLAIPSGIVTTDWGKVRDTCNRKLGIEYDKWQDGCGQLLLAKRADGMLAHTIGGFGLSICRQTGKALSWDTPILTANRGWVPMVDLRVGDRVFHPSGRAVGVTYVSDVKLNHVCYEVTTTDGRRVVADAGHLWTVEDRRQRRVREMTTLDLVRDGLTRYEGGVEFRYRLPLQAEVDLPEADLPVDPYLLGAWLGNGDSSSSYMTFNVNDAQHWEEAITASGYVPTSKLDAHGRGQRTLINATSPGKGRASRSLVGKLRQLNLLNDKHIPEDYLLSAANQRLSLLQGLLDTDGYIDPRQGTVEFSSTNRNLAEGVLFLARSLGWRATLKEGKSTLYGVDMGPKYRVGFTPKLCDGKNPFRLPRKARLVQAEDGGAGRFAVSIKSVERVATRPVCCIKVDSNDGLFLAGRDLIATHNTHFLTGAVFGLSVNRPGLLTIWTAHHTKTSDETFTAMQAFCKRDKIAPFINYVHTGSGDEEIAFINGSRILFGARERGFGRGIPGVDILVSDEGQIMSQRAMQNMLATMNTSNLGLHIYAGTPPAPGDNSEHWLGMRDEAWSGQADDMVWIEIGADDDADIDDVHQYAKANPSFPHRTPIHSLLRLRRKLGDDGFMREGLGVYDKDDGSVFDIAKWSNLKEENAAELEEAVLMVDVSPDRRWSTIAMAGELASDEDRTLVVTHSMRGTEGVTKKILELMEQINVIEVAIFSGGTARILKPDLENENIQYEEITANELAAAYGHLQEKIKRGEVAHVDQAELNLALEMTKTRFVQTGEAESFDRREYTVDVSPAVAAAGAVYRWGLVGRMPVLL